MGQLRTQKLAVGVGIALGAGLTLAAVGAAVLAGAGDGSTTTTRARTAAAGRATYTLRWGDVVRDPRTGTRCEATGEGGLPSLYCTHTARGRYAAVFWNDELQVYGPGSQEMTPTYSFPWWRRLRR